ncbi:MAG: peptidase family C69, partial [Nitriliruptoraceae bacterium]
MCDTVVVIADDAVWFAKNSDRDPNEAQLLEWHPAASFAPGQRLSCTHIDIPQAADTHAVLISRPFWMWGAEMGANEHGVAIGNEAVFTRGPRATTGLTGMDLVRLGLERARTAEQGVAVIVDLLEAHGQGGRCGHEDPRFTYDNSFLVADPTGAFVLETAGRDHAVEVVTHGARSISNGLSIEPFATEHTDRLRTRIAACAARHAITTRRARTARGAADLGAILRDHGEQPLPDYTLFTGGMAAPCMHAGGLLAASQTTGSWISRLLPEGAQHWATATAAPCTSLFMPVTVEHPADLGPPPTDHYDPRTRWWRHERLHRAVMRDPGRWLPAMARDRQELEAAWFDDPPATEPALATADAWTERWSEAALAAPGRDRRPAHVRRYWRIRD